MEKVSGLSREDELLELPPGFRFHPTDEELITHYLSQKVLDNCFCARAIGEVDLNKVEPWDLPWKAKMGEKEWYFFCVRDRKYPTGLRTNRATEAGYWKATGKDKEIYKLQQLVGMKKTLVFYKGRAPKGEKSNWVMHEYRLEGKNSKYNFPKTTKNEWVICRIFHKGSSGKKVHISGLVRKTSYGDESNSRPPSNLPPLMDCSAFDDQTRSRSTTCDDSNVTCFSNSLEDKKPQIDMIDTLNTPLIASSSSSNPSDVSPASLHFPKISVPNSFFPSDNMQYQDSFLIQDQSILSLLLQNNRPNVKRAGFHEMGQMSYEDQDNPISSVGPVDLDCLWNY